MDKELALALTPTWTATDSPAAKVPLPEEAAAEPEPAPQPSPETAGPKEEPQKQKAVKMLFEYKNASARRVSVSGSFTRWKDIPMSKKGGAWKAEVYILPGNYLYHFTVDGKKTLDPGKARTPVGESIAIVNDEAAADPRK